MCLAREPLVEGQLKGVACQGRPCFQARWRGIDIRMVGYLQLAKAAALTIQTKIARPEVARRRCILVRDLRARGENLDSITKRLNRIAMEKAGSIPKASNQRGSAVARAASMGTRSGSGGSISGTEKAELEGEANAMRELAGEVSKALEEIRAENAELGRRLDHALVSGREGKGRKWQQREQVLAAVVDEASGGHEGHGGDAPPHGRFGGPCWGLRGERRHARFRRKLSSIRR